MSYKKTYFLLGSITFILFTSVFVVMINVYLKNTNLDLTANIKLKNTELSCDGISYNPSTKKCCQSENCINDISPFSSLDSLKNDLTVGSSGSAVIELKQFLVSEGFLESVSQTNTDNFDTETREALIRYQVANNITPATGYFGQMTRTIIIEKITNKSICTNVYKIVDINSVCQTEAKVTRQLNKSSGSHGGCRTSADCDQSNPCHKLYCNNPPGSTGTGKCIDLLGPRNGSVTGCEGRVSSNYCDGYYTCVVGTCEVKKDANGFCLKETKTPAGSGRCAGSKVTTCNGKCSFFANTCGVPAGSACNVTWECTKSNTWPKQYNCDTQCNEI
jgi:hypothetical protein